VVYAAFLTLVYISCARQAAAARGSRRTAFLAVTSTGVASAALTSALAIVARCAIGLVPCRFAAVVIFAIGAAILAVITRVARLGLAKRSARSVLAPSVLVVHPAAAVAGSNAAVHGWIAGLALPVASIAALVRRLALLTAHAGARSQLTGATIPRALLARSAGLRAAPSVCAPIRQALPSAVARRPIRALAIRVVLAA
jgi:hypothetical protein